MKPYHSKNIKPSEIIPKALFQSRRRFMQITAGATLAALLPTSLWAGEKLTGMKSAYQVDEEITPLRAITQYKNYYEFGTSKEDPAQNAGILTPLGQWRWKAKSTSLKYSILKNC
jgi:methionine sulfoxide reductase catalytic subunit